MDQVKFVENKIFTWSILEYFVSYKPDKSIPNIVQSLSHEFTILSRQFYNNFIILNPDKCFFMLLEVDELQTDLVCGNKTLKNSKKQ